MKDIFKFACSLLLFSFASCHTELAVKKQNTPYQISVTNGPDITDIDGNIYPTVIIGTQRWTAVNLTTTRYANGDNINYVEGDEIWKDLVTPLLKHGAWCYYENDSEHNFEFGKLYNWTATVDERNLCPDGWRVPTDDDWHTLARHLDPQAKIDSVALNPFSPNIKVRLNGVESKVAGGYLKLMENPTNADGLWKDPNVGATNKALFNAIPAGARMTIQSGAGAGGTRFTALGEVAAFWTSTKAADLPPPGAHFRILGFDVADLEQSKIFYNSGLSVRCVKN